MLSRRRAGSRLLAAAVLLPPLFWLWPSLFARRAPSFRDQGDFFFPVKLYTVDRLRAGELPLWNPFSGAGEPWLANGQSGVFYPPTLLFLLPSPAIAAGLFLLLHYAIGAWGAWRFLKEEGVSDSGALLGAAAFSSCGFASSLSAYWNHFGAWAYLPAIVSLARSGLRTRASLLGLSLLVGLQAMAGSPEISGGTLLLSLLFSLSPRPAVPPPWSQTPRSRRVARFASGASLGLALAGWVLVPMGELALHSDRQRALPELARESGTVGLEGLASAAGLAAGGLANFYLSSLYLGPLVLFAALASFQERERRALAALLAAVALAGLLFAVEGPPGSWLREVPPIDRFRYPVKGLAWTFFGLSILAGLGADSLRFSPGRLRQRLLFGVAGALALIVSIASPLPSPARIAMAGGLLALLFLSFGAARFPSLAGFLEGLAALALLAGFALALAPLMRFAPEAEIRRRPDSIEPLGRIPGRILTPPMSGLARWAVRDAQFGEVTLRRQREGLLGYTNLLFSIPTVRTAAPLSTEAAARIADSMDTSKDPVEAAGPASARVLWSPFRPAQLPSRKVGDFYRVPLDHYRPRLSFLKSYKVEPDAERAWERVAAGELDLEREVFLDREPAFPLSPRERAGVRGELLPRPILLARIAEDRPERVVAEITTNSPGLLLLTDLHFPGWRAESEGRRLPMLRADGFFRAVALPAGSHRVIFRYRPLSFYAGALLSVLSLATILFLSYRGEPVPVRRRS